MKKSQAVKTIEPFEITDMIKDIIRPQEIKVTGNISFCLTFEGDSDEDYPQHCIQLALEELRGYGTALLSNVKVTKS